MTKVNIQKLGHVLSILFSLGFIVYFFWTFTLAGDLRELQLNLLKISYFKFSGLDAVSFILGLIQSFIWGWLTAAVFGWLWNRLHQESHSNLQN